MPAKEDCAARSLVKGELRDEEKDVQLKGNGEDDPFDDKEEDEGTRNENKESRKEDGEETGNICEPKSSEPLKENDESRKEASEETGNGTCEPKSSELSYSQRRKKNTEENKRLLEEVFARHPIPEGLENKKTPKEQVSKKKARSDKPAVRRESQRNKVRRYCFTYIRHVTTLELLEGLQLQQQMIRTAPGNIMSS